MRCHTVMLAVCGAVALACARHEPEPPPPPTAAVAEGPGAEATAVSASATVEDVDQKTRMVTLLTSDGRRLRFRADERVRNLPQVRRGDVVTATYYEAMAVALRPAGSGRPGVTVSEETERAPMGQKPAGVVVRTSTITAKVVRIDRKGRQVTLEGPGGDEVTLKVADPRNLDAATVGDLVEATYREAVAISVDKPQQ